MFSWHCKHGQSEFPEFQIRVDRIHPTANRIAHLYFLRKHGVNAHLVFLYFVNDNTMGKAASIEHWKEGIEEVHDALGIRSSVDGVHEAFVDVSTLS